MDFAWAVVPDEYSKELMLRINKRGEQRRKSRIPYSYRSFPDRFMQQRMTINKLVNNYYQEIKYFRDRLKQSGTLASLRFVDMDGNTAGYWDKKYLILGTERWGNWKQAKELPGINLENSCI